MQLEGKAALVLGAIKGIGKEIGLALAKHGAKVALNYFDWEEELEGLKQDLAAAGRSHLILKTNLLEVDKAAGLIQRVVDRFGRLDILVNNIERGGWPVVHGPYRPEQWDLEMETTLFILKDAPFMTGAVLRLDGGYVLGGEKVPDMPTGVV